MVYSVIYRKYFAFRWFHFAIENDGCPMSYDDEWFVLFRLAGQVLFEASKIMNNSLNGRQIHSEKNSNTTKSF